MTVLSKRQTRNPPSLPAFTLGAVLGLDCLPAAADAGQHNGQAFYTLDPKHVIALDGGDALVILANGQSLLVNQDQFRLDAQGNFVITDAALADDMVQRFGGRPSYSADNVEPGGVALHAEPPEGYQPGTAAAGELDGSSLRMTAPLAGAVGAGGAVTAAFVPIAAIPLVAASFDDPKLASDSKAGPEPDLDDPQPPAPLTVVVIEGNINSGEHWFPNNLPIASAGDVNGDGFDDFIMTHWHRFDSIGWLGSNTTYVVFGTADRFAPVLELWELDSKNGLTIGGKGFSVAAAGDIDGDGIDDLIIGMPGSHSALDQKYYVGTSYVVFGKTNNARQDDTAYGDGGASLNLAGLIGSNGFVMKGEQHTGLFGYSVSSAGDLNNDGIADVVIDEPTMGKFYVLFGKDGATGKTFEPVYSTSSIAACGDTGFVITSNDDLGYWNSTVSSVGDFNGDRIDDMVLRKKPTEHGDVFVVFGRNSQNNETFGNGFDLDSINQEGSDGHIGLKIMGAIWPDSVASAGDLNKDGMDDVIISSLKRGVCYVVFGSEDGGGLELDQLDGRNGFAIEFEVSPFHDVVNTHVSSAGDVNGDGIGDIIIGSWSANNTAGKSYVVFGRDTNTQGNFARTVDATHLMNGIDGFAINGASAGDCSGSWVSSAGDVDSDGLDDVLIGARGAEKSYLIYGMRDWSSNAVVELEHWPTLA